MALVPFSADDPKIRADRRITIGKYTYGLRPECFKMWQPNEQIVVGSFCSFAREVLIFGGGEHVVGVTSYPIWGLMIDPEAGRVEATTKGPTRIGSDVWVGWRAMISSGVTVGHGAIIGAGSMVTKDVAPYTVVAGNPARPVRMRLHEALAERMLNVAWWQWDDDRIRRYGDLFSDPERFLDAAEKEDASKAKRLAVSTPGTAPRTADRFLDLLRASLLGLLTSDPSAVERTGDGGVRRIALTDQKARQTGRDWPAEGETMVGAERLDNVRACVERILADGIPGDLIETGVWRGGTTIYMRGVLAACGVADRRVWVADSFDGVPPPDADAYPADLGDTLFEERYLAVPEQEVRANFGRYGLLDDQVRFLPGWFRDTLPTLSDELFALVRLDGDLYESTIVALENLYPRLSPGGFLIVDDYALPTCRQAVDAFRAAHSITEEVVQVDWTGVFWRKAPEPPAG